MLTVAVTGLTLNVASKVTVEPRATRVVVSNRSTFDLVVLFDPVATGATGYGVLGSGSCIVHPRHVAHITIPKGQMGAQGYFDGTMYLYPLTATSTFASNGTSSAPTTAFVTSLMANDEDLDIAADAMSYDAQSQQRTIAVPIACQCLIVGNHAWSASEFFRPVDLNTNSSPPIISGTGNIAGIFLSVYLYRANFAVLTPSAGVLTQMAINVEEWQGIPGAGGVVTATHPIYSFGFAQNATGAFTPPLTGNPPRLAFQCSASTTLLGISIQNGSVNPITLAYDVALETDMLNTGSFVGQHYPPPIGGGLNAQLNGPIGTGGPF